MEKHKNKKFDDKFNYLKDNINHLEYFEIAKEFVNLYYKEELNRILTTNFNEVSPEFFFKEMVWAICVSGFNSKIVSSFFDKFYNAVKPLTEVINGNLNINTLDIAMDAMQVFENVNKIRAIINNSFYIGERVNDIGWEKFRNEQLNSPSKLQENFAYIGPVVSFHLARNIGLIDNVKEDLHLKRASSYWGFKSGRELCQDIQKRHNFPLGIIDLIFFYSLSTFGSKQFKLT